MTGRASFTAEGTRRIGEPAQRPQLWRFALVYNNENPYFRGATCGRDGHDG